MGMPITLEVIDELSTQSLFDEVYAYFASVDEKFSTYKENSEISLINRGKLGVGGGQRGHANHLCTGKANS